MLSQNTGHNGTVAVSISTNSTTVVVLAYVYSAALILIIALSILCDLLFIIAYIRYKTLQQNNFTFFIFHMSVADLIGTLGIVCVGLISKQFPANSKCMCGFYYFLFFVSFDVSFSLTFFTAVDRYIAILYPIQYLHIVTRFRMKVGVALAWIVVTVALLMVNMVFSVWVGICFVTFLIPKYLFILINCVGVAFICGATAVVYVKMAYCIHKKRRKIQEMASRSMARENEQKMALKATIFTVQLAIIMICLRVPYIIVTLMLYNELSVEGLLAWLFGLILVASTPLVNFLLYCVKFVEVRFLLSMLWRCGRQTPNPPPVQNNIVLQITQASNDRRYSRMNIHSSRTTTTVT